MRKRSLHYIPYPPNDISKQDFKNCEAEIKLCKLQTDIMEWKMAITAGEYEQDPKLARLKFRNSPQIMTIFQMPLSFPITTGSMKEHRLAWGPDPSPRVFILHPGFITPLM